MTRYTIFLTIHGFIITTLAAGIVPALQTLADNPSSIATTLATELPRASTFFLTYITLQGYRRVSAGRARFRRRGW